MGNEIKFNWMLKLPKKDLEDVVEGLDSFFHKDGKRVYPINKPIFLIDEQFNAQGIVNIEESSITDNETSGKYKIIYNLNEEEKKVLNNLFKNMYLGGDF